MRASAFLDSRGLACTPQNFAALLREKNALVARVRVLETKKAQAEAILESDQFLREDLECERENVQHLCEAESKLLSVCAGLRAELDAILAEIPALPGEDCGGQSPELVRAQKIEVLRCGLRERAQVESEFERYRAVVPELLRRMDLARAHLD
jgi:hypothetical protein